MRPKSTNKTVIGGFIHKSLHLSRIGRFQLEKPAIAFGVFIYLAGVILEQLVYLDNLTVNWRKDFRGGLDALYDSRFVICADYIANLRQFNKLIKILPNISFRS